MTKAKRATAEKGEATDGVEVEATTATDERLYYDHAKVWVTVTKENEDGTKDVVEEGGAGRFWACLPEDALSTKGPE